jgi:hypothetical protein
MNPLGLVTGRELDSRSNNGLHVRLLWSHDEQRLAVTVDDAQTGDAFVVDVREGERAMDVFHHPYAYAARRRGARRSGGSRIRTCEG